MDLSEKMITPGELSTIIEEKNSPFAHSSPWVWFGTMGFAFIFTFLMRHLERKYSFVQENSVTLVSAAFLVVLIVMMLYFSRIRKKLEQARIYSLLGRHREAVTIALKYYYPINAFTVVVILMNWAESLIEEKQIHGALQVIKATRLIPTSAELQARLLLDEAICQEGLGALEEAQASAIVARQELREGHLRNQAEAILNRIGATPHPTEPVPAIIPGT